MNNLNPSRILPVPLLAVALLLAGTIGALAEVHYVDVNSANATPPYTNWTTAASNIQDAVDAAVAGDEIVVTNGTYASGGRAVYGTMTNRVAVDKPLTLWSVNGPQVTIIQGHQAPGIPIGDGAIRCVYLTNGASLTGFTLTSGATRAVNDSPAYRESSGGGLFCESTNAVVSNCILAGNSAFSQGGGSYGCTLNSCTLSNNGPPLNTSGTYVAGGGAYGGTLNNCTLSNNRVNNFPTVALGGASGGGAANCTLNNCTLIGNGASGFNSYGGGAYCSTLNNCTLTDNFANDGGGAALSTLNNCTIVDNLATDNPFGDEFAGGASYSTLNNCIVCNNTDNRSYVDYRESSLNNCWTTDPRFVDLAGGNLRLRPDSPCINAGNNSYVTNATDLDGNPRISGGTVDIGAYEFQWPQLSIAASGPNVLLWWPTNNASYDYTGFILQSTTNLIPSAVWSTNSPAPVVVDGQNTVTNPISGPQQFYRLVQ